MSSGNTNIFNKGAPNTGAPNVFNNAANPNIFSGNNTSTQPANTNTSNNNLFGQNRQTGNSPNTIFGNNAPQTNIFGNQNNNPTTVNAPLTTTPSFGNAQGGAQSGQPTGNSVFGNQNQAGNSIFGNNTNKTGTSTNPPAATTGQAPQTSLFPQANNNATNPAQGANLFAGNNTANTTTTAPAANTLFGKTNTNSPATTNLFNQGANTTTAPTTGTVPQNTTNPTVNPTTNPPANVTPGTTPPAANNLFGVKTNQGGTQPAANTAPTANLFGNNTQTANNPTNPTNNLFSGNQGNATSSNQPNPVSVANPPAVGVVNAPPKDDLETQFEKSNQTISELIQEFKTAFTNSYDDLKRLAEGTLKFLDQREENQRIADNFNEVEKMIGTNNDAVMRTLEQLEKQQDDIAHQIQLMSRKIGEGQYTHQLSEHLQQYGELRRAVVELQEGEGEWNDPGQEQLINIFQNLNQVELQIKEMNQLVDVYLREN